MTVPDDTTGTAQQAIERAEAVLLSSMTRMAPAGILVGCRLIRAGDEDLLLAEEHRAITTRDPRARRASGAARHLARGLLARLGHPHAPVRRERSGQPVWPSGIVGSMAHDDDVAVAAVASHAPIVSLGIDVEPAEPLAEEVAALVMTEADEPGAIQGHLGARILFAAKEAVYKAIFPLDGVVLNYDDIAVDLTRSRAATRTGRDVKLHVCLSPRIVVLAIPGGTEVAFAVLSK